MQPLPAFIVADEHDTAQTERAVRELARCGVNAERWQAVSSHQIELQDGEAVSSWWLRLMLGLSARHVPRVVALYLSHYRLWQHILERGAERAVVFDNSVIPFDGLADVLAKIAELPARYGLIQLWSYLAERSASVSQIADDCGNVTDDSRLYRPRGAGYSVAAYVIERGTIEKLLPQMMPLTRGLDSFIFKPWKTGVDYFFVSPCPLAVDYHRVSAESQLFPLRVRAEALLVRTLLMPLRYLYRQYGGRQRRRERADAFCADGEQI